MKKKTLAGHALSGLGTLLVLLALVPADAAEPSFQEALTGGKPQFNLRLRLENVHDDAFARTSSAPTFRARLGYETRSWHHATLLFEVDHLGLWGGEAYNSSRNGRVDRPLVTDPPATDLNQAALKISTKQDDLIVGRQRIVLDNQRFIGGSAWRQNEQTFDAATWRTRRVPRVVLTYSYLDNVNRVFGPDPGSPPPDLRTHGHILHGAIDLKAAGKISAFGQWLDVLNSPALAHQNVGALWTGSYPVGKRWKLPWSVSYVRQQDYGTNPTSYAAHYYQFELGLAREDVGLRAGVELLSGDATRSERRFQTPLATLHAFQGWADKFLTTPPQGIRDSYVAVTGRRWGFDSQLAWHDFRAEAVSRRYGSEWDVSVSRKLGANTELLLKAAQYDAAGFARDTRKLWLQVSTSFP